MKWIVIVQMGSAVLKLYPARDKRQALAIAKKRLADDGRYDVCSTDMDDLRTGNQAMSWDGTTVQIIRTTDPKELG